MSPTLSFPPGSATLCLSSLGRQTEAGSILYKPDPLSDNSALDNMHFLAFEQLVEENETSVVFALLME